MQGLKHAKREGRTTTASWLITAGFAAMVLGPLAAPGVALDCGPQPVAMPNPDNYVSNEKADAEDALNNILDGGSPPDYLGSAGNEASECLEELSLPLGPGDLFSCTASVGALPVTPVKHGQGATVWQLFQNPATGVVYASWTLTTNNIQNGADDWYFGLETVVWLEDEHGFLWADTRSFVEDSQSGGCRAVLTVPVGWGFGYYIDAGAGGWQLNGGCTIMFSWSVTVGVELSVTGGTEVSGTVGGSLACSLGGQYDSESLIRGNHGASYLCAGCIDDALGDVF